MGLDECSYERHMGAIKELMETLPPGWRPTARRPVEGDSHPAAPQRPSIPSPRRPIAVVEPLV